MTQSSADPALSWIPEGIESSQDFSIFSVHRIRARSPQDGTPMVFSVLKFSDWVNVVAVTPDNQLLLVRQYRAGVNRLTLELPGGTIDPGESPRFAAERELREETGYAAQEWVELGVVEPNPALQSNRTFTYLALGAEPVGPAALDPHEVLSLHPIPVSELGPLIARGEITHSLVVCAAYWLEQYKKKVSEELPHQPSQDRRSDG